MGYSADIEIVHKVKENVLRIPTQHLMEGKKVLVYKPDGKLEERIVTTGLANWQYTEILIRPAGGRSDRGQSGSCRAETRR